MWQFREQSVSSGALITPLREDAPLSFRELFDLLENDPEFAISFSEVLTDNDYAAYFLEFPPLTNATLQNDAEFVLIESSLLASLPPDPTPFAPQFARHSGADVITFPNLGGDALLVAPAQLGVIETYPHLAAFLRKAPEDQITMFWRVTAGVVRGNLGDSPRWLSTAGLGVAWLHMRLDTRPKYYSYAPYKAESFRSKLL